MENNNTTDDDQEENEPSWWIDENTAGAGERPDWLPEKFKNAEELGKSYSSLQSKLGIAPSEYDFSKSDSWFNSESEQGQDMIKFAKENHVSQEVMSNIMNATTQYLESHQVDAAKEIEAIGPGAQQKIDQVRNWMAANFSEKTVEVLIDTMNTAESFNAIEEMRNKMLNNMNSIPSNSSQTQTNPPTVAEVEVEMEENWEKYKTNSKFRAEIQQKLAIATKEVSSIDNSTF